MRPAIIALIITLPIMQACPAVLGTHGMPEYGQEIVGFASDCGRGAVAYLVKPIDIRQIVPAVEKAFEQIRQAAAASASAPARASSSAQSRQADQSSAGSAARSASAPEAASLGDAVAMAVGVLMHRYSMRRDDALVRLKQQAAFEHHTLDAYAEAVLKAVEVLSLPAGR